MTTPSEEQTSESISFSLQTLIKHAERRYLRRTTANRLIAYDDIEQTLRLVKDLLPEDIRAQVERVLTVTELYNQAIYTRYYAERISDTQFALREHPDAQTLFKREARIIRNDFPDLERAKAEAERLNGIQRQLDLQYGFWVKQAVDL